MIELQDSDIRRNSELFFNEISKGSKAALMFDDFMASTLDMLYANTPFPEEIMIAPSLDNMLKGDFNPAQIIKMPPPEIDGHKVWRGSTINGFTLRGAGYINGDRRSPNYIALDDKIPHGLLAGATGVRHVSN